ncbi:MAG: hypothetical protein RIT45_1536 [Pseudomonadota bacterium]
MSTARPSSEPTDSPATRPSPAPPVASPPPLPEVDGDAAATRETGAAGGLLRTRSRSTWDAFRRAAPRETSVLGRQIPFLGRRAELERLYDTLRDALNKRDCRVAWLHGPPGLGKSRLLRELERAVAPQRRGVLWLAVSAAPELAGPPTLTGRILLALLDGEALLGRPDAWKQLAARAAELVGERHAAECMAVVGPLVGVAHPDADARSSTRPVDPEPEIAVQFLGSLLRSRGRSGPLVLQIDASRGGVEETTLVCRGLTDALGGISAALLVESRRGPPRALPATAVQLAPLGEEDALGLVRFVLGRVQGAPTGLERELQVRAAGSPERILDLVRGMVAARDVAQADGVWRWRGQTEPGSPALPPATQAAGPAAASALPDRLSRLPAELREVVDAAAIFGATFWFGGVLSVLRGSRKDASDAMSDRDRSRLKAALMQLQAVEVIGFVDEGRKNADVAFAFESPGDAALLVAAMTPDRRRLAARLGAQWLSIRPRTDPIADWARIGELFVAGGRLRQAAEAFLHAGTAARDVGQVHRAVELFGDGARLVEADDADLGSDLRIAHGGGLLRLSRVADAEPVLLEALRMARTLEDDRRCGEAQLRIAQVARVSGRYDMSLGFLEGALKHFRVAGEHRWIADVMDELGLCHLARGEQAALREALAYFLKALALRRRSEDRRVLARSLCHIARVHVARGHFDDAVDAAEEAVQIGEQIVDRWGVSQARMVLGEVHAAAGRYRSAISAWTAAAEMAEELGDPARKLEIEIDHAEALIAIGRWHDAAALLVDALPTARRIDDPELLSGVFRVQASISLERETFETADLDSQQAVEVARDSGARGSVARALLVRGCVLGSRALTGSGASSTLLDRQATEAFDEALETFARMGDLVRQLSGLRSYVHYLTQRGGGPRLAQIEARLSDVQAELVRVSGRHPSTDAPE